VQAQSEPGRPARLEHRPALLDGEGADLTEGIDPAAEWRAGVEHLATDQRDIGVGVGFELDGHDVAPRKVTSSVSSAATAQDLASAATSRP